MLYAMAQNWWAFVARGVLAILFGIAALVWPSLTLAILVILFGVYAIVDGVFAIVAAFRSADGVRWSVLLSGALSVVLGLIAIFWPEITAVVLVYVIGAWALVTGVLAIWSAIALRREIENEWVLGLGGALSIVIGILLLVNPGAGALALTWLIGAYAIAFGVLLIILGVRLRGWRDRAQRPTPVAG